MMMLLIPLELGVTGLIHGIKYIVLNRQTQEVSTPEWITLKKDSF